MRRADCRAARSCGLVRSSVGLRVPTTLTRLVHKRLTACFSRRAAGREFREMPKVVDESSAATYIQSAKRGK